MATKKQLEALAKGREALKKKQAKNKKVVRKALTEAKKKVKKTTSKIFSKARKKAVKETNKVIATTKKRLQKKGEVGSKSKMRKTKLHTKKERIVTALTITILKSSSFITLPQTFKRRSTTTKPRLVSYTINGISARAKVNQFIYKTKLLGLINDFKIDNAEDFIAAIGKCLPQQVEREKQHKNAKFDSKYQLLDFPEYGVKILFRISNHNINCNNITDDIEDAYSIVFKEKYKKNTFIPNDLTVTEYVYFTEKCDRNRYLKIAKQIKSFLETSEWDESIAPADAKNISPIKKNEKVGKLQGIKTGASRGKTKKTKYLCDSCQWYVGCTWCKDGKKSVCDGYKPYNTDYEYPSFDGIDYLFSKPLGDADNNNKVKFNFRKQLTQFFSNTFVGRFIGVTMPKKILLECGIPNLPIIIRPVQLKEKIIKHNLTKDVIKNLNTSINAPLLVFRSLTKIGTFNVIIEKQNEEGIICVSLHPNKEIDKIEVTEIASIHGRNLDQLINWCENNALLYGNSNKTKKVLICSQFNSTKSEYLMSLIDNTKVVKEFIKSNNSQENLQGCKASEYFKIPIATDIATLENGIDEILKNYSGRDMAAYQAEKYLKESIDISNGLLGIDNSKTVQEWLNQSDISFVEKIRDSNIDENNRLRILENKFGKSLKPISFIPQRLLDIIGLRIADNRVYCSKAYFLNHYLHHDKSTSVNDYFNLQKVLFEPDEIIETNDKEEKSFVFVKKISRYNVSIVSLEKEKGKIVLHKTFFVQQKKPYKSIARLFEILSEDARPLKGIPSIVHTLNGTQHTDDFMH